MKHWITAAAIAACLCLPYPTPATAIPGGHGSDVVVLQRRGAPPPAVAVPERAYPPPQVGRAGRLLFRTTGRNPHMGPSAHRSRPETRGAPGRSARAPSPSFSPPRWGWSWFHRNHPGLLDMAEHRYSATERAEIRKTRPSESQVIATGQLLNGQVIAAARRELAVPDKVVELNGAYEVREWMPYEHLMPWDSILDSAGGWDRSVRNKKNDAGLGDSERRAPTHHPRFSLLSRPPRARRPRPSARHSPIQPAFDWPAVDGQDSDGGLLQFA